MCRTRGIYPDLVTPVIRRKIENSKAINTHGDYPDAVRTMAVTGNIPLIDLHRSTKVLYERLEEVLGKNGSKAAFIHYPAGTFPGQTKDLKDDSHFNAFGGYEAVQLVVEGIRRPLSRFFPKLPLRRLSRAIKPEMNHFRKR